MVNTKPARFTLSDGTTVTVKKVTNNKYDFELRLSNGNRKTFVWMDSDENEFSDRKGSKDRLIVEALKEFKNLNDV